MSAAIDKLRLVINAEGRRVDAGIYTGGAWSARETEEGDPVETLASVIRKVLDQSGSDPQDFGEWVYSGGPGSLLGLRSLAMLLSTWEVLLQPGSVQKFRFSGLVWTAREIKRQNPGKPFTLISPWRTNTWNAIVVRDDLPTEDSIQVRDGEIQLEENESLYVLGERFRATPPPKAVPIHLPSFSTLPYHLDTPGFLIETDRVEPRLSGTTEYRKWSPPPGNR